MKIQPKLEQDELALMMYLHSAIKSKCIELDGGYDFMFFKVMNKNARKRYNNIVKLQSNEDFEGFMQRINLFIKK